LEPLNCHAFRRPAPASLYAGAAAGANLETKEKTMTKSTAEPIEKPVTLRAKCTYRPERDAPDLPEILNIELTGNEVTAIKEARAYLGRNPAIHSVNVKFASPEFASRCYDMSYITVMRMSGCYLFLQGEYDDRDQVEYSLDI
jgi:hypothetical protein